MMYQKSVEVQKKAATPAPSGSRRRAFAYQTATPRQIKEPLLEFFAKYADAIGQLDESEKVAVYASGGDRLVFSIGEGWGIPSPGGTEAGDKDMLAVARKADIIALRSGQLKTEDFSGRVVFRDVDPEVASSDIDIMARIIDTALQGRARQSMFHSSNVHGIYLDNYGVLFFTSAFFDQDNPLHIFEDVGAGGTTESLERRLLEWQTASAQRREDWAAAYKKLKLQLGELIADYGHTLRQLKPQDNIVITADLENAPEDAPRYLVCRAKKQQVEAFNARRISREQLLKQIAFLEY